MAKVFLDANCFIDSINRKAERNILSSLEHHTLYISTLSVHIYCYIFKIKIPDQRVIQQIDIFQIVEYSDRILHNSLRGPMSDFEDNVQLHSAVEAKCDIFLTADKKLLGLSFFGKTRIVKNLLDSQS